jgi:septum site-determining protein MinC
VTTASPERKPLRFRGRSFLALVLAPEPPLEDWMGEVDEWVRRSPGFFIGRPVVLDVSALSLDKAGLTRLVADLAERDVRILGMEGTKASLLGLGMPPLVSGGRQSDSDVSEIPAKQPKPQQQQPTPARKAPPKEVRIEATESAFSLVVESPIRSGQSIVHPQGDVTIVGSVSSGAEIIAGGSIHVYGALRGRAIAGTSGNPHARIFCGKLEAELVGIDGLYRTADTMEAEIRGRSVQTWLDGTSLRMSALN